MSWPATASDEFALLHDPFAYDDNSRLDIRTFPAAGLAWVVDGERAIPVDQSAQKTNHPGWDIAFQPGRITRDPAGDALTLIELPFALLEKGANCTHNGVLRARIRNGELQSVRYAIRAETCAYLKFDMSGSLDAALGRFDADTSGVVAAWRDNQRARLPVVPLDRLVEDYPGFDLAAFDVLDRRDTGVFGFVVDGKHYRSDCITRDGTYAFCDEMLLPSYSTAKSAFAALALMRLEALAPGAAGQAIDVLVPACTGSGWKNVTVENAIDMATGHYVTVDADVDEASAAHVAFLYTDSHDERIRFACKHFPRREQPGSTFVYHSSDTYLAGTAMQAILDRLVPGNQGLYEALIVEPYWKPMALSGAIQSTMTSQPGRQALAGWGLFYTSDDIARVARWLADGAQGFAKLDQDLLQGALQQDDDDRGLPAGEGLLYNNGFWAYDVGPHVGCDAPAYVPFMSGYGGIAVVLFPNGTVYYYFGDGYEQRWRDVAVESHKLGSLCP